jgi:uncharacterized membrane protein
MAIETSPSKIAHDSAQTRARSRIIAIDALRGLALLFMALDHAAAFVNTGLQAETYGGEAAQLEGITHWLSGLITNIAAPTFWLLSGVSIALFAAGRQRAGDSEWQISRFLLIRAIVIIVLDLTICEWAWNGSAIGYTHVLLSLGFWIAALSILRLLPLRWLILLSITILLGYQAFLPWIVTLGQPNILLAWLLSYNVVGYPAIEFSLFGWGSLPLFGFVLGSLIHQEPWRSPNTWLKLSGGLLVAALVLRAIGGFGDLVPYQSEQAWHYFIILSKTPPALDFFLFNLGLSAGLMSVLCLISPWLDRKPLHWIVVCGQVSLFFFVLHIVVYGLLGRALMALDLPLLSMVRAYGLWIIGLGLIIPLCIWYRQARKSHPLLRYL